jgi:hypothetical protein
MNLLIKSFLCRNCSASASKTLFDKILVFKCVGKSSKICSFKTSSNKFSEISIILFSLIIFELSLIKFVSLLEIITISSLFLSLLMILLLISLFFSLISSFV